MIKLCSDDQLIQDHRKFVPCTEAHKLTVANKKTAGVAVRDH